jgi:hypothetical protein
MSKDENKKVVAETSNSKEPATLPSKASAKENDDPAKPAEERKVIVVEPSKTEYKERYQTEYPPSSEEEAKQENQSDSAKAKEAGQSFKETIRSLGKKAMTKAEGN